MNRVTILQGHVLDRLKELPDNSVHCVVTSPPYFGLRDYGIEPQVWGGDKEGCRHEWGNEYGRAGKVGHGQGNSTLTGGKESWGNRDGASQGHFCRLCGTWRGSYGLEPTIDLYVQHTVQIFREVRRVLRKDGVCFLNIGDSYAANRGYQVPDSKHRDVGNSKGMKAVSFGLKPKDLCMVPARVALALQADGWWLRSEITWIKPNPLPESVTDRPTKSTEKIYLLVKSTKYHWDAEAVREKTGNEMTSEVYAQYLAKYPGRSNALKDLGGGRGKGFQSATPPNGRNLRDAWTIATEAFSGAHFAVFPQKLVETCLKAGTSERGCCPKCGAPWVRVVELTGKLIQQHWKPGSQKAIYDESGHNKKLSKNSVLDTGYIRETQTLGWRPSCKCITEAMKRAGCNKNGTYHGQSQKDYDPAKAQNPSDTKRRILESMANPKQTIGWESSCNCKELDPIPCTVLDPFGGAGTVGLVAAKMGRDAILIELKPEYCTMAAKRLRGHLGMLAEVNLD